VEQSFVGKIIRPVLHLMGWFYYSAFVLCPVLLPRFMGGGIGLFFRILQIRSHVIFQNLNYAFPGMGAQAVKKRKKLYSAAYQHFGELIGELFMLFGPLKYFLRHHVDIQGLEHLQKALQYQKGVFILTSHVGNWEILAGAGAQILGLNSLIVTKKLKPAWLHHEVVKARAKIQVKGTYEPRTLRDVLAHLKANGLVGFVLDQYSGPPVSVRVPFFGIPVGTGVALATLVKRTGACVVPAKIFKTKKGKFLIEFFPELHWKSDENYSVEIAKNTAYYVSTLEGHIRLHPEQWLWTHKRFKGNLSPLRKGEWQEGRGA
jgi:Kdo2-lipid IVA lauroyltransferase/acyltransferase